MTAPPRFVLDRLDARFEQLNSSMDFDDAFATLGLERYQVFLTSRALGSGGMSGERTYLDLGADGYTLETVTYWDGRRALILRTPTTATPREAELACVEARLAP